MEVDFVPQEGCVVQALLHKEVQHDVIESNLLAAEVNIRLVRGWLKLQQLETRLSTQKSIATARPLVHHSLPVATR